MRERQILTDHSQMAAAAIANSRVLRRGDQELANVWVETADDWHLTQPAAAT